MQNYLTEDQIQNLSTKIIIDMKPILQKRIRELLDETLGEYIESAVKEELEKYGYKQPNNFFCCKCNIHWRLNQSVTNFDYCPNCGSHVALCRELSSMSINKKTEETTN